MQPKDEYERQRIELLYLIHIAPLVYDVGTTEPGDSRFPVELRPFSRWSTVAEDLAYSGLIRLDRERALHDVAYMTPKGRATVKEWTATYGLEQRLVWDESGVKAHRRKHQEVLEKLGDRAEYWLPRFEFDWRMEPETETTETPKHRDSGHYLHPPDRRLEIVKEWHRVQHKYTQSQFAAKHGISERTLRRYIKEYEGEADT